MCPLPLKRYTYQFSLWLFSLDFSWTRFLIFLLRFLLLLSLLAFWFLLALVACSKRKVIELKVFLVLIFVHCWKQVFHQKLTNIYLLLFSLAGSSSPVWVCSLLLLLANQGTCIFYRLWWVFPGLDKFTYFCGWLRLLIGAWLPSDGIMLIIHFKLRSWPSSIPRVWTWQKFCFWRSFFQLLFIFFDIGLLL